MDLHLEFTAKVANFEIRKGESVQGKTRVCCCNSSGVHRSVWVAVAADKRLLILHITNEARLDDAS